MQKINLIGQTFGRLTVLNESTDKKHNRVTWDCICACGKSVKVTSSDLKCNRVKSCGCLNNEIRAQRGKEQFKKYNKYDFINNICIVHTNNGNDFYIDKDDYYLIKDICWYWHKSKDYQCVVGTLHKNKRIFLTRYLLNTDEIVDHINGDTSDNTRKNLRIVTKLQNNHNHKLSKNNKSGYTGVTWYPKYNKWCTRITVNRKIIFLGYYENLNEAIKVRLDAEKKYFGEYARELSYR